MFINQQDTLLIESLPTVTDRLWITWWLRSFGCFCTALLIVFVVSLSPAWAGGADAVAGASNAWPELSREEHQQAISRLRAFGDEAREMVNGSIGLLETEYFLFYSNLEVAEARQWAGLLDRMYKRLGKLFGIGKQENLWLGKAVIFVFTDRVDFVNFEVTMFQNPVATSTAGLCHTRSDGRVVIAFYRQSNEMDFAGLLVHESVHGFLHRYRSPVHISSWANEGLAELISYELVPKSQWVPRKYQRAKKELKKLGHMGGDFFDAKQIKPWQYGVAFSLARFMVKQNKRNYVSFINGIKDGLPWEKSLESRYGVPLSRLVAAYGRSVGVRALTP